MEAVGASSFGALCATTEDDQVIVCSGKGSASESIPFQMRITDNTQMRYVFGREQQEDYSEQQFQQTTMLN